MSPILILMGWSPTKQTSGVTAAFVLVNSFAGLAGLLTKSVTFPPMLSLWAVAVVFGGVIGSELGIRRLASQTLRRVLSVVLVIAASKLILML